MRRIIVLATLTVAILGLGATADGALRIRVNIEEDERAADDVQCDGTVMTWRDCALRRIAPGEGSIRGFLVQQPLPVLFGTFFLLAGFCGGLVGSWLRLAGIRPPVEDARLETCLVTVGAIAGIVAGGLLIMPGVNTASVWISQSPSELTALRRAVVIPVLAGLYTATFFRGTEDVLKWLLESFNTANQRAT